MNSYCNRAVSGVRKMVDATLGHRKLDATMQNNKVLSFQEDMNYTYILRIKTVDVY